MKKTLQNLMAIALMTGSFSAVAQPSLNASNTNPVVGEVFTQVTSSVQGTPGSAGANQTWNFSSWPNQGTATFSVMSAASTPSGSSFPSANVSLTDGNVYGYQNNSASGSQNWGSIGGGAVISLSNSETLLSFPCNFGTTTNDNWQGVFTVAGPTTFTRTGVTTTNADAWGTVTTPIGTYNNCMRIHIVQSYTDASTSFTLNYTNNQYMWYQPGKHYPIASTYTLTTFTGTSYQSIYLNSPPTGISEKQLLNGNLSLFPIPASGELNLNFNSRENGDVDLRICDATGKHYKTIVKQSIAQGDNALKVNTLDMPAGIYFIGIYTQGVLQHNEKFVVVH